MTATPDWYTDHAAWLVYYNRQMFERFGYRPSKAPVCPWVVTGKRCRLSAWGELCLCERFQSLLDHGRMWIGEDGRHVLTGEPYRHVLSRPCAGTLADFQTEMAALGLVVAISEDSPYNPGNTVLITVSGNA